MHGSSSNNQSKPSTAADRPEKQVLENATAVTEHPKSHMSVIGGNEVDRLDPRFCR